MVGGGEECVEVGEGEEWVVVGGGVECVVVLAREDPAELAGEATGGCGATAAPPLTAVWLGFALAAWWAGRWAGCTLWA